MWTVAVTRTSTEFSIREHLLADGFQVFLPYTREKHVVTVIPPRTTAMPRPRHIHKAMWRKVARWPGYIFAGGEDLNALAATRGVIALVRNGENEPARLTELAMVALRKGCAADGEVLRTSEVHGYSVGDMLRFVAKSALVGRSAQVLSIEDNGDLRVLVDNHLKAVVNYTELTN